MEETLYPALRGVMGDRPYYVTTMRLHEVAQKINYAKEIHQNESLNDLIQRRLNDTRAKKIAAYLQREEQRFFNALVVGVYGGDPCWYDFEEISPRHDSLAIPANAPDVLGFLGFNGNESLFAIDGQHRLAGIRIAVENRKDELDLKDLEYFRNEQVAVIFVAHHSGAEGLQRTRRLFSVLNKTAKPVLKGDIIALDEDDVMAITTRRLLNECGFFNRDQVAMRLLNSLPPSDKSSWTTIYTLYDMLQIVFHQILQDGKPKTLERLRFERPAEQELNEYYEFAVRFFELFANSFPEVSSVFKGNNPQRFVTKYRHGDGGSVLFRPLGQKVFTQVVAQLCDSYSLTESFKWLSLVPTALTEPPFRHVIWNPSKKTMTSSKTDASIVRDLILYMLHENTRLGTEELRIRYSQYLGVDDSEGKLPNLLVEPV